VAILAAILLWRMRPVAAHLLAIRAAITLLVYLFIVIHHPFNVTQRPPRLISPTMVHGAIYVIGLGIVALNMSIAWYAYNITVRRIDDIARPRSSSITV
jgi:hypothetical protein